MADIEKVIKGLERCLKHTCPAIYSKEYKECEYTVGLYCRQDKLLNEALELLKEQHETIKSLEQEIRDKNVRLTERAEQVERLLKKSVPQSVVDQIRWERDTALSQLKEIGKVLGEKMDDVKPKKGKWTDIDCQTYTWKIRCNKCGYERSMMSTGATYPRYCEGCGSRMDGEQE